MSLSALLQDPAHRAAIVDDAIREVEAEVAGLSGMAGTVVAAGYKALNKLNPALVRNNMDRLIPKMAQKVDPHFAAGQAGGDVPAHFIANGDTISEDLLSVTDEKAAGSGNKAAVAVYDRLRGRAKHLVVDAMPRLGAFVERHVG